MNKQQMKELDRWFLEMHNILYSEHDKLAEQGNGFMGALLESAMGAHDRAWAQFILNIPFDLHQQVLNEAKNCPNCGGELFAPEAEANFVSCKRCGTTVYKPK